jgi:hypothetical protein
MKSEIEILLARYIKTITIFRYMYRDRYIQNTDVVCLDICIEKEYL